MSQRYLGENLVFIISQPRSGSTLLQRVLAGNDAVVASSEPWLMLHPVYGLRDKGITADYSADWALQGVKEFLEIYTDGPEVYDDGIRAFAQAIYSNAIRRGGGNWFIDKTPRYLMIVDDLVRLFPKAKFIFLLRNPLSVLASIVNSQISHDLSTLERFRLELLDGPAAMLKGMEKLDDDAIVVRYEEFVTAPEKHTRRICDEIGLTYQDGMVDYSNAPPLEGFMQDRVGIHSRSRPTGDSLDSWQQLLTDAQQVHFAQSYLRSLGRQTVEKLGYSFDELNEAVCAAAEHAPGKVTLEWQVALLNPHQMKGMDHLAVNSYRYTLNHGPLMARLKTFLSFWWSLGKQIQWVFGKNDVFKP
ncbi:MAG: sulfotransferase [Gammaproteobacteria bacterium]|jgi:hypothetical protein